MSISDIGFLLGLNPLNGRPPPLTQETISRVTTTGRSQQTVESNIPLYPSQQSSLSSGYQYGQPSVQSAIQTVQKTVHQTGQLINQPPVQQRVQKSIQQNVQPINKHPVHKLHHKRQSNKPYPLSKHNTDPNEQSLPPDFHTYELTADAKSRGINCKPCGYYWGKSEKCNTCGNHFIKAHSLGGPHRCPDKDICGGLKPRSDCPTNW